SMIASCGWFRHWQCIAAIFALMSLSTSPSLAQPFSQGPVIDEVQLRVPFHRQDTLVWCWVASAKMVVEAIGEEAPTQCQMLEQVYGAPCCTQPWRCARAGHITEIQNLIGT